MLEKITWPLLKLGTALEMRILLRIAPWSRESESGSTILHTAAILNDISLARDGIARGINLRARDKRGRTAADLAVLEGHDVIAELLLPKGESLNLEVKVPRAYLDSAEFEQIEASGVEKVFESCAGRR